MVVEIFIIGLVLLWLIPYLLVPVFFPSRKAVAGAVPEQRFTVPRWTYAPLVAWVVCSLWPSVLLLFDLMRGVPLPYGGIATLLKEVLDFVLALAIANWAFVGLFFVVRRKARERQQLPIGSLQAAMWFSLVAMLIPTGLLMLLLYYLTYYGPHGRGSGIANGIVLMFALLLQIFIQPIFGLIGWFAGHRSSVIRHA